MGKRRKHFAHFTVRFPTSVMDELNKRRENLGAASINPVVAEILERRFERGDRPEECCRDPLSDPVNEVFIGRDTVVVLREWAKASRVTLGAMTYALVVDELRSGGFRQQG